MLNAKYNLSVDIRKIAKTLGRLGGRARAKKLSAESRKKIAALGGLSRALSHHAERRIRRNFYGWQAVKTLRKPHRVKSVTVDYLETAVSLAESLEKRGLTPVLIGGMALVILGSERITNDFDFVLSTIEESAISKMVDVFYEHGLELVSKLDKGRVVRTIGNKNVAAVRLKLDAPSSAFFYDPKTEIKIDLLFDFPFPAKDIASRARKVKIKSRSIWVASTEDLLRLKEIAYADRKSPNDAHDLDFLKTLRKKS